MVSSSIVAVVSTILTAIGYTVISMAIKNKPSQNNINKTTTSNQIMYWVGLVLIISSFLAVLFVTKYRLNLPDEKTFKLSLKVCAILSIIGLSSVLTYQSLDELDSGCRKNMCPTLLTYLELGSGVILVFVVGYLLHGLRCDMKSQI